MWCLTTQWRQRPPTVPYTVRLLGGDQAPDVWATGALRLSAIVLEASCSQTSAADAVKRDRHHGGAQPW